MNRNLICTIAGILLPLGTFCQQGPNQALSLKEAVAQGAANYGRVKAKKEYSLAAYQTVGQLERDRLPNFNLSAQQDYGSVNGQNGPLYGLGGLGVASSGLPLPAQNWNSAFGALYLVNVNWEFFTFGRARQKVTVAKADVDRLQKDYEQELFQHKVKVSAAYFNLLASQRLLSSQQKNLERAQVFHRNVAERARKGLLPGVDSLLSSAEVSKARITLNQVKDLVKTQNNELVQLMGAELRNYMADTSLIYLAAPSLKRESGIKDSLEHPLMQYQASRIAQSREQEKLFKGDYYPSFTVFGVYQTRASGFKSNYAADQTAFTTNYLRGINPTRQNYLMGVGMVWNLTTIARSEKKINSQELITKGLEEEYKALDLELQAREDAANSRLGYALQNFNEAPLQVNAAQQAYAQRLALYNNGLATLTDVITAQFTLNRAETDRDVAFTNVWQALLMKVAATGDFDFFLSQF